MSLPIGTYAPASITYRDAGNELTNFRVYGSDLTAANFDAVHTAWNALISAADALTLGNKTQTEYANLVTYTGAQPTNGAAREIKLLVQYRDSTTGKRYTATLGTLDPTLPEYVQNINARDVVVVDSPTEITDFITAFEGFVKAPETGNAVTVIGLKVVGRTT